MPRPRPDTGRLPVTVTAGVTPVPGRVTAQPEAGPWTRAYILMPNVKLHGKSTLVPHTEAHRGTARLESVLSSLNPTSSPVDSRP
eukprot:2659957-Rhodomonas_salina.2